MLQVLTIWARMMANIYFSFTAIHLHTSFGREVLKFKMALMSRIIGVGRLYFHGVFSNEKPLIMPQPIYKKSKLRPRQDVYYMLFTFLFSNISKTYKSKTLIVNQYVYIFKSCNTKDSYYKQPYN